MATHPEGLREALLGLGDALGGLVQHHRPDFGQPERINLLLNVLMIAGSCSSYLQGRGVFEHSCSDELELPRHR